MKRVLVLITLVLVSNWLLAMGHSKRIKEQTVTENNKNTDIPIVESEIQSKHKSSKELIKLAYKELDDKNDEEALILFKKAVELGDGDEFTNIIIARINKKLGNYNEAIKYYNKQIKGFEGFDNVSMLERGYVYLEMKNYAKAVDDFSRIINECCPSISDAWLGRARAYYELKEYDLARKDCTVIIDRIERNSLSEALKIRALIKKTIGDLKGAEEDVKRSEAKWGP